MRTIDPHDPSSRSLQKYSFKAEDLEYQGHLGDGAFGTVTKMLYPPTQTTMAVKVRHKINIFLSMAPLEQKIVKAFL